MPLVNVMVNARAYTIACDEGEEDHLKELASHVDKKVRELLESIGQVGDQRLILMAAVLIADEYFDAVTRLEARGKEVGSLAERRDEFAKTETLAVGALEDAAKRLEKISAKLASA